jgi:uncharacterized protein YbjT (DUF2867 family)
MAGTQQKASLEANGAVVVVDPPNIVIVGASGFVGHALIAELLLKTKARLTALSRRPIAIDSDQAKDRLFWRACDLHNLKDIEEALDGQDVAIYLVHSMLPTAGLSQGDFADYDLILADNFARAARLKNLKHAIYLSGLIPQNVSLSRHLQSRVEVGETLQEYLPKVTIVRAGLIVGATGSSLTILTNLVRRLPVMICPRWTLNSCQTVSLKDVVKVLMCCVERPEIQGKTWDVGSEVAVTYLQMLQQTAALFGLRRRFIMIPISSASFSKMWVRLVSGAPKNLVYPLIDSLKSSMLVREGSRFPRDLCEFEDFSSAMGRTNLEAQQAVSTTPHAYISRSSRSGVNEPRLVRSIQRLPLPKGRHAAWVAEKYLEYLPRLLPGLIRVDRKGLIVDFCIRGLGLVLLRLRHAPERSQSDRQLFYVVGGLLYRPGRFKARFEIREALQKTVCLVAVHDFQPALPWLLYLCTQAQIHRIFMQKFGRHLE